MDKNQTTPTNEEQQAAMWQKRFEVARDYQIPLFEKWSKWYEDMYAYVNRGRMAPWRSKVYMPIIASKVWDLISRFIQYRPGWDVTVRTLPINTLSKEAFDAEMEKTSKKIEKVKAKLDYDYDCPLAEEPIQDELLGAMLDAAVTGQGMGRVPYLKKNSEYRERIEGTKERVTKAQEGYNAFQSINIFNVFMAPSAKGLQKSPWLIIHDFMPLAELKANPKYKNLDRVNAGQVTNEFAQYEVSRNRLVNTQDVTTVDQSIALVEIFECWDKATQENVIYAAGAKTGQQGWVEIYRGKNPYWHKKYPFVAFYIRRKPYQFWGESIFENSETLQSAVNDIFNHFMDGHNMADGMIAIEEGSVVEPYRVQPGGEIRYRGEIPKQFKFPQPDAANMQTAMNLITGSIENATISQYASGVPNSSVDDTQGTATGVTRMMEAAAEKVGFMRSNFRRSWREVGQMWVSNTQQFMDSDVVIEKVKNGEKGYDVIKPEDNLGLWNIRIDDSSFEPISKDQKLKDFLAYTANLQAWQEASVVQAERVGIPAMAMNIDWDEVAKRGSTLNSENYSHFVLPAIPTQQPVQSAVPVPTDPGVMPPEGAMPMPADEALAPVAPSPYEVQPDGKSMPNTFPVRSINNPALL